MKFMPFTSYDISQGEINCPLCSSQNSQKISNWDRRFKRLQHVKCDNCALIRQMPLPSKQALEVYYTEEYRSDYQNVSSAPTQKHRKKRLKEGAKRLEVLEELNFQIETVLDYGCGSGEFIELCNQKGFTTTGFEPGKGYAEYARKTQKLNVISGSSDILQFEKEFDLITSFHVFEHLIDPLETLQRMEPWLKPNGKIFIEVPNIKNALHKGFGCLHFAHTLGFSRYSLEYLGAIAGMKIDKVFDNFDLGIVFEKGTPRPLEVIADDARKELSEWSIKRVHRQYWKYTLAKIIGKKIS